MAEVRLDISLKHGLKLILTPEQRQAIELMMKPVMEVALWVQEEMTQNPMIEDLEQVEPAEDIPEEPRDETAKLEDDDEDWLRNFHDGSDLGYLSTRSLSRHEDITSIEHIKVEVPTLAEHLLWQIRLVATPEILPAAEYIIRSLDERGFFTSTVEDVVRELAQPVPVVERALRLVQTLDPAGVGARDLKESLLIQVDHMEKTDADALRPIIEHHLDDAVRRNYKKISTALKIRMDKVQEAVELIGMLNPHPGRDFGGGEPRYIVPDVFIREVKGRFEVIVNDNPLPRLGLNPRYLQMIRREGLSPEEKTYLKEKMTNARWVLSTLRQRNQSLYLVARHLVDYQPDFFRGNFDALKPLTLQQVADALGLSVSTVSRLSNQKYADTPVGLYQIKFFFSGQVQTRSGHVLSSRSVKEKIKALIEAEDIATPLSDVEILDRLRGEGIHIQRRTVAKYREGLGILPKRLRRSKKGHAQPDASPDDMAGGESEEGASEDAMPENEVTGPAATPADGPTENDNMENKGESNAT